MEEFTKQVTVWLAEGVEGAAALVIGVAAIEALWRSVLLFVRRGDTGPGRQDAKEAVRLHLGRWLAVALEFELAADILRTAITPTWNEIGQLAAIAVLRTALNYFLQQEIDKAEARRVTPGTEAVRRDPAHDRGRDAGAGSRVA